MSETGTTPTPRPALLTDTQENTPPLQRPSTWYGISKVLLDLGALGTAYVAVPENAPFRNIVVGVLVLNFLSGLCGQASTWFVRAGVTNLDTKTETLAARTEKELAKDPVIAFVAPADPERLPPPLTDVPIPPPHPEDRR